jgi:cytochrome c-type biogenesis protein CcmH/NrfF
MQVWIELHGVPYKPAYQTVTYIEWHIPDVLIQLILLMMGVRTPETR